MERNSKNKEKTSRIKKQEGDKKQTTRTHKHTNKQANKQTLEEKVEEKKEQKS